MLQDEKVREEFVDFASDWTLLANVARQQQMAREDQAREHVIRAASGGLWRRLAPLAAAAAVLVAVGVWWGVRNAERGTRNAEQGMVAKVVEATDAGCWILDAGGKKSAARVGTEVGQGQGVETGEKGRVKLAYVGETTEVEMGERSTLNVQRSTLKDGKSLDLQIGNLAATVAKQGTEGQFVVTTPQARAEVKGTKFSVIVERGTRNAERGSGRTEKQGTENSEIRAPSSAFGSTRLEVADGLVRFSKLSDGKAIDVAGGQYAVAAAGVELVATAIPSPSVMAGDYPKPRKHLYGKVLFEDDFDHGLDNWEVVVETAKDGGRFEPMGVGGGKYVKMMSEQESLRLFKYRSAVYLNFPATTDAGRGDQNMATRFVGIRSRKAIEAERFVIEVWSNLEWARLGTWWDSGIEVGEIRPLAQNKNNVWPVGVFGLLEFEPAPGQDTRGILLCRIFGVDREVPGGEFITWMESRYVCPVSRKIVLAALNGAMGVDKIVVREMREE